MNTTRTAARWFAGLAVVSTLVVGAGVAPAQAKDTGWNPTSVTRPLSDTGWNPTAVSPRSDTGWNPTTVTPNSDTGWNPT
jgi:hypothetical protein